MKSPVHIAYAGHVWAPCHAASGVSVNIHSSYYQYSPCSYPWSGQPPKTTGKSTGGTEPTHWLRYPGELSLPLTPTVAQGSAVQLALVEGGGKLAPRV